MGEREPPIWRLVVREPEPFITDTRPRRCAPSNVLPVEPTELEAFEPRVPRSDKGASGVGGDDAEGGGASRTVATERTPLAVFLLPSFGSCASHRVRNEGHALSP